jgi:hypothetical protein
MKTTSKKPCDLPCPKCGSTDMSREFLAKGEELQISVLERERRSIFLNQEQEATRDCIAHYCRVCSFRWQTNVAKGSK